MNVYAKLGLLALAPMGMAGAAMAGAPAPSVATGSGWPDVDGHITAAKAAMMGDPTVALRESEAALSAAERRAQGNQRTLAVATSAWLKGEALIRLNKSAEAGPVIDAALAEASRVAPGAKLQGDLLKARGTLSSTLGQVQPALEDFHRAFVVFQRANIPRSQAIVLQDIGAIYDEARDFQRTIKYYKQSEEIFRDDPALALAAHNNLGNAYRELGQLAQAKREFKTALAIARRMNSPALIVRVLPNVATTQLRSGELAGADASLAEAMRVADADPAAREWKQPYIWGVMAQAAQRRGDLQQASAALEQTFKGVALDKTSLPFREFHETAYQIYARLGNTGLALQHLQAFKRLDDEARQVAASTSAALVAAQFDFANQDLKITRLRAGQLQRDMALASWKARLHTIVTFMLLGAGAIVLFAFFTMRRSRDRVRAANVALAASNSALATALNAKTEFLATTSHEIRTPLNGILGMTQVLLADPKVTSKVRERIEVVHGAGETMRALVDDLLDVAKMETGQVTVVRGVADLEHALEQTVQLWRGQAESKGLTIALETVNIPRHIHEDEARLRQILFNLMSNALKFTDEGGVVLRAEAVTGQNTEELVISVTDTGIGIADADRRRIFDAFTQVDGGTTRRFGGTGLGLAICRDVAQALGGTIAVEGRVGVGSCFTVRLPLTPAQAPQAVCAAAPTEVAGRPDALSRATLLILEPNPLTRSILRAVLQPEACVVEVAADLASAEAVLSRGPVHHVLAGAEACVQPGGTEADGVRQLVRAAGPAAVTLTLADATAERMSALLATGVRQVLERPIEAPALVAALKDVFGAEAVEPIARAARVA